MPSDLIYLDYNATTPVDPRVVEIMQPFLCGVFGNPSSDHRFGREARAAVERARAQVAACLGCRSDEVVLTSGGSESNNLAIRGVVSRAGGGHVMTSAVEHPAVLEVVRALELEGSIELTVLPVDRWGRVEPEAAIRELRPETVLVTLMLANNEVGTLQPVSEVARACRQRGVLVHTDAAQAVGKIPVDVLELDVDLLTVAGHKLYAPKGVGALYVRRGVQLDPLIRGAAHEMGLRAGTENVLEAVGLGAACDLVRTELDHELTRMTALRDRLQTRLQAEAGDVVVHGHPEQRLPNTLSIGFPGIDSGLLLTRLADGTVLVSTLDFFTPVVDSPRLFGAIAAANALSDVYAMGAQPLFALNIAAFPIATLPASVLVDILEGAGEVAEEADVPMLGGHTVEDTEPKFGWVVVGTTSEDRLWRNAGARPGDLLVLTKPIGTGIWATAAKHGVADPEGWQKACAVMRQLNRQGAEVLRDVDPRAVTDVTGFGLLGHLHEMLAASGVDGELWLDVVPILDGTDQLVSMGEVPGGTESNLRAAEAWTSWGGRDCENRSGGAGRRPDLRRAPSRGEP